MKKSYSDKLVTLMKAEKMDAILVCPSEELLYLIGFSPMSCERFQGLFIKNDGSYFYVCNMIYSGEMAAILKDMKFHDWFDGEFMPEALYKIMEKEGLLGKTVGVNSSAPAFNILDIAAKTNIKFVNAKPLLEEMRIIKSDEDLNNLRKAAEIADKTFDEVIQFIKPGMKEAEVKSFIYSSMKKQGGINPWAIVARGPNSSFPHYKGDDGVIEKQDVVLLDMGCIYNNMRSDISRMVFVGGVTDEQKKVYEICRKSTEAAEAACFEGAFIPDIDKAARDVVNKAGYKEAFFTRLGHGIGYMGHEAPDIKTSNPRKLEKGMCFTIEPGINLLGKFGMRVEDVVAITDKGTEILNKATHEMIIVCQA